MPLSFGVPFGLVLFLLGGMLARVTSRKRLGRVVMSLGVALVLVTVIAVALAARSTM